MHPLFLTHLTHHFASVVRPYTITKNIRFFEFHPPFLFLVTATMLVGGRNCRTQFWKGIAHGPFHQSLVSSGQAVSEENIFSNCVRTDNRRKIFISETTGPIGTKLWLVLWWPPFKIVSDNPDIQPTSKHKHYILLRTVFHWNNLNILVL
jgi:hypothetical protein